MVHLEEIAMKTELQNSYLPMLLAVFFVLGFSPVTQAALVTSADQVPNAAVIDFSEFTGGWQYTAGPVQIGNPLGRNIEWSSTYSSSVIGDGGYGLDGNGNWTSARVGYTGVNTNQGSMTFRFNDAPVSAVGGFVNYAVPAYAAALIEALDQNGVVLESYDLNALAPISTPNATDAGAFRGIARASADIYALRVSNGYVVLDDLAFSSVPPVPVPTLSAWAMVLLAGLLGLLALARRRA